SDRPEAKRGGVELRHQPAFGQAKRPNAAEELLLRRHALGARGRLCGEGAVPLPGDEARVRLLVGEEQNQLVVLKTGAEPDSGGAEPHERDVAAVARPRDARAPRTRDDQSAFGRIEDGMTVGYVEQRRGVLVLSPQPIEG